MSFVYAEKSNSSANGGSYPSFAVYSDTRVLLSDPIKLHWSNEQAEAVAIYGMAKTIITSPECCISFAGNNILFVHELMDWFASNTPCTTDALVDAALRIHTSAPDLDQVEFIICTVDDDGEVEISLIKDGAARRGCENAWIGSPDTFAEMQRIRIEALRDGNVAYGGSSRFFEAAIRSGVDDTVGGFSLEARFQSGSFRYADRLHSEAERQKIVRLNETIPLFDTAENGGFTVVLSDWGGEPCLEFPQIGKAILYTRKYRMCQEDIDREELRHFLLPIICETHVGDIVCSECFDIG